MTSYTLTTSPHQLDSQCPNVSRELLIAAKRRRIAAIEGWASPQTMERERAELATLEAEASK